MTLAITGATGHLGRHAIEYLLANGTPAAEVVALVRDPAKASDLSARGVDVRVFDYDRPDELAGALGGVTALLLVSGSEVGRRFAQHRAVIDAAKTAGVAKMVYTSIPNAQTSINPLAVEHKATEDHLVASGIPHIVLRNGWYHENQLAELSAAAETGVLVTAAGEGTVASAPRSDYAEAAAIVLAGDVTSGIFTLTGDVAWSQSDLVSDLSTVLGREIELRSVTAEGKIAVLTGAGLDADTAGFVVGIDQAIAAGELGEATGVLSDLIGHRTTPLVDTLRAASLGDPG